MRNEKKIKLGSKEILLRPTFENMIATENEVGGISYLAWRFANISAKGATIEERLKNLPTMTEMAKIIYLNQASVNPTDENLKKYSLQEIWAMVLEEGLSTVKDSLTDYISLMAAGNKHQEELTEEEKKSLTITTP